MEQLPITSKKERGPSVEVEQKYLLASEADAKRLGERIKQLFPDARLIGGYSETPTTFPEQLKKKLNNCSL